MGSSLLLADEFYLAISENDSPEMIRLLKSGRDPDAMMENGLPALLLAWQYGHVNSFEILLEMGASPHQMTSQEMQITVDDELLTVEAGLPAIAVIVQYSRLRPGFLEIALRYLRTPNQVDVSGKSIYHHHAISNPITFDQRSINVMMINCGVDRDLKDGDGFSAARQYVRRFLDPESIAGQIYLFDGVYTFFFTGSNLLQAAADGTTLFHDLHDITEAMKRNSEDLWWNEKSTMELFSIIIARVHDKDELVHSEIEDYGHSICHIFRNPREKQVCYWATSFPHVAPDSPNPERYLNSGGSLDHQDEAGATFLWAALMQGNQKSYAKLLELGSNPDLRLTGNLSEYPEPGETKGRDFSFGTWFGVRGETVLLAACSYPFRRKEFIRPALAVTKEVNQTDELDRNLLHRFLYHPLLHGQEELLQDLISAGVDLNAQTISGATPCHVAVAMNPTVIPALVEAGSDPSIQNMHGQTVEDLLRLAIQEGWSRQSDYQNVLDWLSARKEK